MKTRKPRILLAGESIYCDVTLKRCLTPFCEVIAVNNLSLAEKVPQWSKIDIVVLEVPASDESKLTTIKYLKKYQPIILVVGNGNGSTNMIVKAFQLGAKDYFHKPCDPMLLVDRIQGLLRTSLHS